MWTSLFLFSILAAFSALASNPYAVGAHDYNFTDQTRGRQISTHVWYPIHFETAVAPINPKEPFQPVVAALNSPIPKGSDRFPVVLMSHGSMGNASRLFWLAEALVKNGMIVIAVDHPGNMFGDSSADGLMRIWDRAKDLTFALNEIIKVSDFQNRLDLSKVSAVGYSAGAAAVLLMGGARFSFERYSSPVPNCAGSKDPFYKKQCDELAQLNPKSYGKELIEGDYSDPRIQSILSLDPGFARSFQPESFKKIKNTLVWIAPKLASPQDEIFSKDFLKLLGSGQAEVIPDSDHMTFLQACKPGLPIEEDAELKELCHDTEKKLRLQTQISQQAIHFLRESWKK